MLANREHASNSIGQRESSTLVTYERPPGRSRITRVRASSIAILVLFCALSVSADVIRLKNGRTIWADQVRQNKDRVEYDVGEDTYAIPKSAVDRIDAGGMAPQHGGSGAHDIPDFTPTVPTFTHEADITEKVIHDGKVDGDALSGLEHDKPELAATGYFLAGKHESDAGNFPKAKTYFESALRFQPENSTLLTYYSACLLRTGHAPEAVTYADRAVRAAPDSPDASAMLGFAQFASDHTADAIRAWKRSVKLRPDAAVSQYLAKAERESSAESDFTQRESSHFNLHFEGKDTSEAFRRDLLATLDSQYD